MYIPEIEEKLDDLAEMAENENWDYQKTEDEHHLPILFNYIQYTYKRLAQEDKIVISENGQCLSWNTGLVTSNQEPIYAYCNTNRREEADQPWFFQGWKRKGEYDMTKFSSLPEMAHYFDDPSILAMDARLELRTNIEHIVTHNKDRFPTPYNTMDDYAIQTLIKGAIDNARERVKRNYKTAIPHFYREKVQLMLPLCLGNPNSADLALVIERHETFYRASTCLTLDMAYNNARQLAKPDRDWLIP
ncbi:MAG: DUF3825 domain-containing protein [Cytophagales bacterium]|nr:DUF3825 domain-containing protein [Cytophagales bacterium]